MAYRSEELRFTSRNSFSEFRIILRAWSIASYSESCLNPTRISTRFPGPFPYLVPLLIEIKSLVEEITSKALSAKRWNNPSTRDIRRYFIPAHNLSPIERLVNTTGSFSSGNKVIQLWEGCIRAMSCLCLRRLVHSQCSRYRARVFSDYRESS